MVRLQQVEQLRGVGGRLGGEARRHVREEGHESAEVLVELVLLRAAAAGVRGEAADTSGAALRSSSRATRAGGCSRQRVVKDLQVGAEVSLLLAKFLQVR